jgi:hypothetical protein
MTNKTITLSRELLDAAAVAVGEWGDSLLSRCNPGHGTAMLDLERELRDVLNANPVPPAGGEPEEWCDKLHLLKVIQSAVATNRMRVQHPTDSEAANVIYRAISEHLPIYEDVYDQVSELIEPFVARPYRKDGTLPASVVESVRALLKDRAHVTRLQAEVDKAIRNGHEWRSSFYTLQSELTKAREVIQQAHDRIYANETLTAYMDLRDYLSNQSAPADKGQGEPVAWMYRREGGECLGQLVQMESDNLKDIREGKVVEGRRLLWPREDYIDWKPLYAEQPAPVVVVMPERDQDDLGRFTDGWNACLDEFVRLNQIKQ